MHRFRPSDPGRLSGLLPLLIALLLAVAPLFTAACNPKSKRAGPPRPTAAKKSVSTGIIVQLRLAVESFDTVFDTRAEEQDLLPMLVHAWATFYGWTDPTQDTAARYRFTEQLCRARLKQRSPRDLFRCMDGLRAALLQDLAWATNRYLKIGHPDKVGSYSLGQLLKETRVRLKRFRSMLDLRQKRRERVRLFSVKRCRLDQPLAPVLTVAPRELSLNGFPIITQADGVFDKFEDHELEGLRHQLESRLMESQTAGKRSELLILAIDERLAGRPLLRIISLASGLGVSRVCLKATRKGSFTVPCCLPVRLSPKVVRPRPALELDAAGLHRVTDVRQKISTDRQSVIRALKELGAGKTQPPLVVLPGARTADLMNTVHALQGTAVVEIIPSGVPLTAPKNPAVRRPSPAHTTPGAPRHSP